MTLILWQLILFQAMTHHLYLPRAACAVAFLKLKCLFWTSLMWWIVEVMETVALLPVAAACTITARL
jgi:hypothetical protein